MPGCVTITRCGDIFDHTTPRDSDRMTTSKQAAANNPRVSKAAQRNSQRVANELEDD